MAALGVAARALARQGRSAGPRACLGLGRPATQARGNHVWHTSSLLLLRAALPVRGEPLRKKKKVDPKKEQAAKDRLKKRIKKLEKATQELIPIEDFITPVKYLEEERQRPEQQLPLEDSERRTFLMKRWALYKQQEHEAEREKISSMLEAQQEALRELRLESEQLYEAAARRDKSLFPFDKEGPTYTPATPGYQAPEGRYNDITKVYVQVEHKR
ncbi:39S ribosomal protein L40, mitochondrial [Trichosurus vulpecula]|uniref:39S ribosomal protein L40, mitochondrial n=1 Tax=Trichosurus vulpecula TaxID=9337 RepID=UPI00186B1077|nr:39S ribosomal protein L40, mitochondrial [Trichosurus vulpecula]